MAEEQQRCQEGHRLLCANNCGFFGNPATMNLCSQCFHHASPSPSPSPSPSASAAPVYVASVFASSSSTSAQAVQTEAEAVWQKPGRCTACNKKVGVLAFQCRCGASYCGVHRYPEQHGCGFDFKKAGREAIARANPVVKKDKLNGRI